MNKNNIFKEFVEQNDKFQKSWLKFTEIIIKIKDEKVYKELNYKSFKEFVIAHIGYLRQTIYKMIRAYNFIKDNYPKLLDEDNNSYIPPYGYINLIFSKYMNEKQQKIIEKMVFSGISKKEIVEKRKLFIENTMPQEEKKKKSIKTVFNFAKSFKKTVFHLKKKPFVNYFISEKLEKLLDKIEDIIRNDLYYIENSILNS